LGIYPVDLGKLLIKHNFTETYFSIYDPENQTVNIISENELKERFGYLQYLGNRKSGDAIELERRKELFVKGHQFFDLKRTTRNLVRSDCGSNFTTCSLFAGNRAWAWTIPIGEIITNDLINDADQNLGYN